MEDVERLDKIWKELSEEKKSDIRKKIEEFILSDMRSRGYKINGIFDALIYIADRGVQIVPDIIELVDKELEGKTGGGLGEE